MACTKQVKTEYNVDDLTAQIGEATDRINRLNALPLVADGDSGVLVVETIYSASELEEELVTIQNRISRLEDLQ